MSGEARRREDSRDLFEDPIQHRDRNGARWGNGSRWYRDHQITSHQPRPKTTPTLLQPSQNVALMPNIHWKLTPPISPPNPIRNRLHMRLQNLPRNNQTCLPCLVQRTSGNVVDIEGRACKKKGGPVWSVVIKRGKIIVRRMDGRALRICVYTLDLFQNVRPTDPRFN